MLSRLLLAAGLSFCACACVALPSTYFKPVDSKSYAIGATATASVGSAFVSKESGSQLIQRQGGKEIVIPSKWAVTEELVYAGRQGSTLRITYREFRGDLAAPSFFQDLTYNLDESSQIRFRNFTIDVLKADNQGITFVVISDGSRPPSAP